jgi:exosortase F-associated protein
MNRLMRIGLALLGLIGLVAVRFYEQSWFYDPLLDFFKSDHKVMELPQLAFGKLMWNTIFRFVLNTSFSIMILWAAFQRREIVQFALILYALGALILLVLLAILLQVGGEGDHMTLFYVRRFLIQPIGLFVMLPAFYFYGRR